MCSRNRLLRSAQDRPGGAAGSRMGRAGLTWFDLWILCVRAPAPLSPGAFRIGFTGFALAIALLALASLLLGRLEVILGYGGCSEHVSEGLVQKVIDANGTIQFLICDDRCVVVENAFLPVNRDLRILAGVSQGLAVGVAALV